MATHSRKLLPLQENHNPNPYSSKNYTTPVHKERENQTNHQNPPSPSSSTSSTPNCCYNNLKLNPPFDSAMALTVLVLLTALFFMGFFSIYIRRFAEESSGDPTRRRRGSGTRSTTPTMTASSSFAASSTAKGVDPTTIKALPVHAYYGGGEKQRKMTLEEMECAICLSEFEEREWIKQIPYCGHVFHVECIDTWLASHVTCPLCRSAKLLSDTAAAEVGEEEKEERGHVAGGGERSVGDVEGEVRVVVDGGDTWHDVWEEEEVGPIRGERRSSSCSWFGERVRLHRSLSF